MSQHRVFLHVVRSDEERYFKQCLQNTARVSVILNQRTTKESFVAANQQLHVFCLVDILPTG